MQIKDIPVTENIQSTYHLDSGTITVFQKYLVAEFDEGMVMGLDEGRQIISLIYDHFGDSGDFGWVCNRVNPFSIIPIELTRIEKLFTNSPKIAIIHYTTVGRMSAHYEQRFWPFPVELFDDLPAGISWMNKALQSAD